MEAKIKEIFESIQGEGPVVGYKQLFIRFCGCNLNCSYCDTDFKDDTNSMSFTPEGLYSYILNNFDLNTVHSVSLTGGEPLLNCAFLLEFLPLVKSSSTIYLETNATLTDEFLKLKKYIDIVAADIKLPSCTGQHNLDKNELFLKECNGIETFAKIVFDGNITDDEIIKCAQIANDTGVELILQPMMNKNAMVVSPEFCESILDKFLAHYKNCRLIPQVHKFINVR